MLKPITFVFLLSFHTSLSAVEVNDGHKIYTDGSILNYMNSVVVEFETIGSIEACIYLTQRFAGLRDDAFDEYVLNYHLAKKYALACIDKGVNNTPAGWAINLWLATIYNIEGYTEEARKYLIIARDLDTNGQIKSLGLIKRYKLHELSP